MNDSAIIIIPQAGYNVRELILPESYSRPVAARREGQGREHALKRQVLMTELTPLLWSLCQPQTVKTDICDVRGTDPDRLAPLLSFQAPPLTLTVGQVSTSPITHTRNSSFAVQRNE